MHFHHRDLLPYDRLRAELGDVLPRRYPLLPAPQRSPALRERRELRPAPGRRGRRVGRLLMPGGGAGARGVDRVGPQPLVRLREQVASRSEVEAQSDKGASGNVEVEVKGQLMKKAGDVFAAENAGTSFAFISQICVF